MCDERENVCVKRERGSIRSEADLSCLCLGLVAALRLQCVCVFEVGEREELRERDKARQSAWECGPCQKSVCCMLVDLCQFMYCG